MRFVFVGDSACGKSSMLLRYYNDSFTLHYNPTKYELFSKAIIVNNEVMDLEMWDTSGDIEKEQLSRLNYLAWDAVFLCYDVSSMRSFHSARSQWLARVRQHCPNVPIIFVALQTDKRVGPGLWAPLYPNLVTRVTATEGAMTADIIGARKYVECSAQTGQGISGALEEGVRAVFERRQIKVEEDTDNRVNRQSRLSGLFCM
ncbi:small GTPase superfamily, partial [Xylariaceae sp. FL1272]